MACMPAWAAGPFSSVDSTRTPLMPSSSASASGASAIPITGLETRPLSRISCTSPPTASMGTAKETPELVPEAE